MIIKKIINCLTALALTTVLGVSLAQDDEEVEEQSFEYNKTIVPLVRVIANPKQYNGKLITVKGYYHSETHLSAVFLDRDSCLHLDTENSILLDKSIPNEEYIHCIKIDVQGKLNHTREYYGFRYKSDLILNDTVFKDFKNESQESMNSKTLKYVK